MNILIIFYLFFFKSIFRKIRNIYPRIKKNNHYRPLIEEINMTDLIELNKTIHNL